MKKDVVNVEVLEKSEALCDFCYGVAAGIGIGLGIIALT
jgi:hypothetical protein